MESLARIAIVEDDEAIGTLLGMALAGAGFVHVKTYARGDDALKCMRLSPPDLVLLDVMLPGLDGFAVASRMRSEPSLFADTRILMLTALSQNEDIVRGLDSGADDYLPKPYDRGVLLARVRALLRRETRPEADFDGLAIDEGAQTARLDGAVLKLTPGEFKILTLLVAGRGRVLSRARIIDAVVADDKSVTERTVDVQIANLRRKLGAWGSHIETIRGVGYRISV